MGCSVHACIAVEELVQNTEQLRILHLHNNMSGDEGATAIAKVGTQTRDTHVMLVDGGVLRWF